MSVLGIVPVRMNVFCAVLVSMGMLVLVQIRTVNTGFPGSATASCAHFLSPDGLRLQR
jgi:hypothetical protein